MGSVFLLVSTEILILMKYIQKVSRHLSFKTYHFGSHRMIKCQ